MQLLLQLNASLLIMSLEGHDLAGKISQATGNGNPGDKVDDCVNDDQSKQVQFFWRKRFRL
jgi:hypothetical protein